MLKLFNHIIIVIWMTKRIIIIIQDDQPEDMERATGTVPSEATPTFARAAGPFNITLCVDAVVAVIVVVFVAIIDFIIQL